MKRGDKPETQLPPPVFVDPRAAATNPQAARYAQSLAARRYEEPRGGPPSPPIPPLNAPHEPGMSMAAQAALHRAPSSTTGSSPSGIFGPEPQASQGPTTHITNNRILPTDTLPPQAQQDPLFREGHGSMFASNQPPALAQKYGVVRNGQLIAPQQLQTRPQGLSPKTIEGLQALQDFQQQRAKVDSGETAADKAAENGMAAQAARLANPSGDEDVKPVTESDRKRAEERLQDMDDFDYNQFREVLMKDLLNNEEERRSIEERLTPLDLTDVIMKGRAVQRVPVVPGKYEPEFQSMTGEEELALKRLLMEERKQLEAPDRYLLDKFQIMVIACSLRTVNKIVLPDHLDQNGHFNDDMFWEKFNRVVRLPFHMLASIGVHYFWFDIRVRRLFVVEKIKNG